MGGLIGIGMVIIKLGGLGAVTTVIGTGINVFYKFDASKKLSKKGDVENVSTGESLRERLAAKRELS